MSATTRRQSYDRDQSKRHRLRNDRPQSRGGLYHRSGLRSAEIRGDGRKVYAIYHAIVIEVTGNPELAGLVEVCGHRGEVDRVHHAVNVRITGKRVADEHVGR